MEYSDWSKLKNFWPQWKFTKELKAIHPDTYRSPKGRLRQSKDTMLLFSYEDTFDAKDEAFVKRVGIDIKWGPQDNPNIVSIDITAKEHIRWDYEMENTFGVRLFHNGACHMDTGLIGPDSAEVLDVVRESVSLKEMGYLFLKECPSFELVEAFYYCTLLNEKERCHALDLEAHLIQSDKMRGTKTIAAYIAPHLDNIIKNIGEYQYVKSN